MRKPLFLPLLCAKCGKEERTSYHTWGKICLSAYRKRALHKYPQHDEWKQNWFLRHNHGITKEEYDLLFFQQAGLCAICGQPEKAINSKTEKPRALAVDHNHETGEVRALLCTYCNQTLAYIEKDRSRARKILKYLQKHDR